MSVRSWDAAWLVVGMALVLGAVVGLATGAFGGVTGGADSSAENALVLIAVVGFGIAAWQIHRDDVVGAETADAERPGGGADGAGRRGDVVSREADDPVVAATPEYAATVDVLSGQGLSWVLDEGGAVAREDRTVAAGEEWVRPTLRGVLLGVLVHEHRDRTAAEAVVDEGDWTDDRVAASVVSGTVTGPPLSLRGRIYAWLFPERVLRERVRVTVDEIARVADETLPSVPGEHAPRTIPVVTPSVDDLQRTADGDLDLAVGVTTDSSDGEESRRDGAPAGEPDRESREGDR